MWSNEKVLKLIEDYHASSCLWDVTSSDYKNRVKKKLALESLAAKHDVTVADIEKKIHNLKTSFNRERKKNNLSSGTSPVPLQQQSESRDEISNDIQEFVQLPNNYTNI